MKNKLTFNRSGLRLTALAAAMAACSTAAIAQTDSAPELSLEEVVVTGYKASLEKARDLKRNAVGSQDSIVATDIAAFPDLNLAESLQRVSGITITREAGEGRQISLRGLGADFTRVEVNGMEALGTSASTLDAKGAVGRSRGFDFNVFASELFSQVDVKKSYAAETEEGGLGGTVALRTAKPFDYDGFTGAVSGQLGTNSNTETNDPRLAFLLSNTWDDKFGALVSVAYSQRDSEEFGLNTTRWRRRANDTAGANLSAEQRAQVENGEIWFPRGLRHSTWKNDSERLGVTASFQYQPTENFSLTFDALIGELRNDKTENHWVTTTYSLPRGTVINALETERAFGDALTTGEGGDLQFLYGEFDVSDQSVVTESRADTSDSDFENFVLSGEWQVTDALKMDFLIGTASAELNKPKSDKAYIRNKPRAADDPIELTVDCRGGFECVPSFANFDPTSTESWDFRELRFREDYTTNDFDSFQLDFEYALTDTSSLKFGINSKKYENTNQKLELRGGEAQAFTNAAFGDNLDIADSGYRVETSGSGVSWIVSDLNSAQSFFGVSDLDLNAIYNSTSLTDDERAAIDRRSNPVSFASEETFAYYLQYDFSYELGDTNLIGNVGVRRFDTEAEGNGRDFSGEDAVIKNEYSGTLPALNLAWEFNDNMLIRASWGKNINRPPLGTLNPTPSVNPDPERLLISGGTPFIKHMESTEFETSFEWYFPDDVGYMALAYYSKDIDNYITERLDPATYGSTGFPLELIDGELDASGNPQSASTVYNVRGTINIPSASFSGWELSAERDFDFLPGALSDFGVRASYTLSDGESTYPNLQGADGDVKKPFVGLSDKSYNVTFYYENDTWGGRLSQSYRSDFISRIEAGLNDEDERGFHAMTFVDFSAFYNVSDNIKVTFKANNLTDEAEELYTDSSDRHYAVTTSGRNYYIGATYKF